MLNEMGISASEAAKYTFMPQVFPRLKKLFGTGFSQIPMFILIVFNTVRLIPDNHPYLDRNYKGKYSLIKILALAANNLTFDRKNIDKITIFGVVLAGIAMIVLQIILLVLALLAAPAYAYAGPGLGPRTLGEFFSNANPNTDIAFRLMDMVFGVPGIFTDSAEVTPFHEGFHALLEFYSYGILLVGVFIIIYLVTTIVLETADSGVPFGQRFNKAWAPVRLILFFALLLPTSNGLNLAQMILLNAAKYGSNLATNGWVLFDQTVRGPYIANAEQLIARPSEADMSSLAGFMAVAKTCSWAEGRANGFDIRPYLVYDAGPEGSMEFNSTPAFVDLVSRANGGAIFIRFGVKDETLYANESGAVFPYCGELSLTIVDQGQPGSAYMQQAYLDLVRCMWTGEAGGLGNCYITNFNAMGEDFTKRYLTSVEPRDPYVNMAPYINDTAKYSTMQLMHTQLQEALTEAIQRQRAQGSWARDPAQNLGWGGAGIWFNKIAEQNGAMTSAVFEKPVVKKMPYVMEFIKDEKMKEDINTPPARWYTPEISSGKTIKYETSQDRDIALVLNQVYQYWSLEDSMSTISENGQVVPESSERNPSGNVIIDFMNLFMGTRGLFDMCKNADVHPLAQLSALGRGMVEHSIATFGIAFGVGIGGGLAHLLKEHDVMQAIFAASKFFISFASLGLFMGFLLFYVLPFIPFIYFFFAVMTWVKAIFEAMVGMPLWALAHLRIDGQGMSGDAAAQGYYYIFEIFLRPLLIIISFLGAIVIYSSMVKVLNSVFYLVISNLTGHDLDPNAASITGCFTAPGITAGAPTGGQAPGSNAQSQMDFARGAVDQFFYTVLYAIIVFIMAGPCFKLVDAIPDKVMTRWLGVAFSTFGAQDGDPADGLMANVTKAIYVAKDGARGLGGGLGIPFQKRNK